MPTIEQLESVLERVSELYAKSIGVMVHGHDLSEADTNDMLALTGLEEDSSIGALNQNLLKLETAAKQEIFAARIRAFATR